MKKLMTYSEAIREGMSVRMREDPNVVLFGEDVGRFGGCFGVSAGMFDEFGEERVRDTPISESAIIGCAVGSSSTGLRPIAEIMMMDFLTVAMDQMCNNAAKLRYMTGGKLSFPMVIRTAGGAGVNAAAQHSQSLEAWVTHVPGLKMVFPSTPQDAYGLMLAAIDDDNPVVYEEHKALLALEGEVDLDAGPIPLGEGEIKREGGDFTVIAVGKMVHEALSAADQLAEEGVELEVFDPRTLYPFDFDLLRQSVSKTHKAILISEEVKRGGYMGEISAWIGEELFDELDAPVVRIGALNTPVPFSSALEPVYLPNAQDIVRAVKSQM
ncbi:MAG: alpha-ketoacid dehydrogenase subunit beta [Peptoniphilus sp.]|nr:alpha-ketoacid dehydrogenase subunit beta [Peptoniphilus sp.]MDD7362630.1 alpha-ketoacid dehydrogenase subunit beta [Bacillota bacterium]MDY6044971.1 alpha-ketoacid dehydrogenase subunit beta [Peptoniphilus sp.]